MIVDELIAEARHLQTRLNETLDKLYPLGVDAIAVSKYHEPGYISSKRRVELMLHFLHQEKP